MPSPVPLLLENPYEREELGIRNSTWFQGSLSSPESARRPPDPASSVVEASGQASGQASRVPGPSEQASRWGAWEGNNTQ